MTCLFVHVLCYYYGYLFWCTQFKLKESPYSLHPCGGEIQIVALYMSFREYNNLTKVSV